MLHKLTLGYFKAYRAAQTIEFAEPSAEGLGLTVLVGPNNSGKSTALEALKMLRMQGAQIIFDQVDRHSGHNPVLDLEFSKNGTRHTIKCSGPLGTAYLEKATFTGSTLEQHDDSRLSFLKYVPSRRPWVDTFNPAGGHEPNTLDQQEMQRDSGQAQLGQSLRELTRDGKKNDFDNLVRRVLPDMSDWTIDRISGSDRIVYRTHLGITHALSVLGDGYSSVFRMAHTLFRSSPGDTIILDEPELSLHPQAQQRLYQVIQQLAKDRQIVVATHSPYFVNWSDLIRGARLYRFDTSGTGVAAARELTKGTIGSIGSTATQVKNRKLFDAVAKEVFFAEKVVFAEGQEDVHIISAYIDDHNDMPVPFFGYGSGGASVIEHWLAMAADLGLTAVGLYDGDHAPAAAAANLKFAGHPNIHVMVLPKDDIRDKHLRDGACAVTGACKEVATVLKEGFFDNKWKVKPAMEPAFRAFLDEIRGKLNS